jgi:PAS domain S-box-containing protein
MGAQDQLARLLQHEERLRGGPELAAAFGATHLCFFIRDPELHHFLPATGFPQRLRGGVGWSQFLLEIERHGSARTRLYSPFVERSTAVAGLLLDQDACLVLFGEGAAISAIGEFASSLRVFGALLLQEARTRLSDLQMDLSRRTANESRQLAASLSDAHDMLSEALQAKEDLLQQVQKQEDRLRQVRRIAGIGTWEFDAVRGQMKTSPEVNVIFGFQEGQLPTVEEFLARIHPDDRETVRREIGTLGNSGREHRVQFRVVWPNGSIRWVEERGNAVFDAEQKVHRFVGFSLDITQRVLTEETLIRSEKLSAAGRLAASIAHEINNPLEAVVNLIYLAKSEAQGESVRQMLDQADRELARVAAVSRQALAFYRELSDATPFDIRSAVDETIELFRTDIGRAGVEAILELPSESIEVVGWPGEIKQVISNLLINALHASSPGSILRVRVRRSRDAVRIVVADQGHGIRDEHRLRIFEPFFSTKHDSGTGLGLWVTQQIVTKHGGSIRVRSRVAGQGHGTVFVIRIPLNPKPDRVPELHQKYRSLAG